VGSPYSILYTVAWVACILEVPAGIIANPWVFVLEFTEVDSCQRQGKCIDEEQDGRIVLVVSFVLEERIDRRVFW